MLDATKVFSFYFEFLVDTSALRPPDPRPSSSVHSPKLDSRFIVLCYFNFFIIFESTVRDRSKFGLKMKPTAMEIETQPTSENGESSTTRTAEKRSTESARILELEYEVASLENFLRDHSDTEGIVELRSQLDERNSRVERLEYTVAEFEDFLKENPDVKDLHDLKRQLASRDRRIHDLENWIEINGDVRIEKSRIMELEEMVTNLEEYVRSHDVDALKRKLQDREGKIEQLEKIVETFRGERNSRDVEKRSMIDGVAVDARLDELKKSVDDKDRRIDSLNLRLQDRDDRIDQLERIVETFKAENYGSEDVETRSMIEVEKNVAEDRRIDSLKLKLQDREERIDQLEKIIEALKDENYGSGDVGKRPMIDGVAVDARLVELEKIIDDKDRRIDAYESQVSECQERVTSLRKEMIELERELAEYEAQDIGVLKEEIRVRDERVSLLEEEIDSLERALSDRIDLEQIGDLVSVMKEKADREQQLENELREERERREELAEALRGSVVITSEAESKLKQIHVAKRNALERVSSRGGRSGATGIGRATAMLTKNTVEVTNDLGGDVQSDILLLKMKGR